MHQLLPRVHFLSPVQSLFLSFRATYTTTYKRTPWGYAKNTWNVQSRTCHPLQTCLSSCSPFLWLAPLPTRLSKWENLTPLFSLPLVKDPITFQVLYIPSHKEVLNPPVSLNSHCHYLFQGPVIFLLDEPLPGLPACKLASVQWLRGLSRASVLPCHSPTFGPSVVSCYFC